MAADVAHHATRHPQHDRHFADPAPRVGDGYRLRTDLPDVEPLYDGSGERPGHLCLFQRDSTGRYQLCYGGRVVQGSGRPGAGGDRQPVGEAVRRRGNLLREGTL